MAREMNASEEQERESSEWNVRELSAGEFDALSAASEYGGFQQTSEMAILAQSEGMQTQYVWIGGFARCSGGWRVGGFFARAFRRGRLVMAWPVVQWE